MRVRITHRLNDGLAEAPPFEVKGDPHELASILAEELTNDYGVPAPPGSTLLVEVVDESARQGAE
jgi:hypothetical protein